MNPVLISRPCLAVFSMSSRKMAGTTSSSGPAERQGKRAPPAVRGPVPTPLTSLPVKPVRPMTAYTQYMTQRYVQMKQEKPGMPMAEAQKVVSIEWKTVDESVRQQLEQQRKTADERYKELMKQYKDQLKQTVVLADVVRLMQKKRSHASSTGKKKLSGYNVFVTEKTSGKKGCNLSGIAKEWASLSEWEKKRYNDKAASLSSS